MSTTEKQFRRFKKLDETWRNDVMGRKDPEDLFKMIKKIAINRIELNLAKEQDEDLRKAKEAVSVCEAVYKEGDAEGKLQTEFLVECLKMQGIKIPGFTKKQIMAEANQNSSGVEDAGLDLKKSVERFSKALEERLTGDGVDRVEIKINTDAFQE